MKILFVSSKVTLFVLVIVLSSFSKSWQSPGHVARGVFSVNLIQLKLQRLHVCPPSPPQGPGCVFRQSYGLIKFAKVRHFNHNQLRLLSLSIPSSLPNFPLRWVAVQRSQAFWGSSWGKNLSWGEFGFTEISLCLTVTSRTIDLLLTIPV